MIAVRRFGPLSEPVAWVGAGAALDGLLRDSTDWRQVIVGLIFAAVRWLTRPHYDRRR